MILFMRLLHIVLGVFWAGTLVFTAFFLLPSIRDAGPEGAKVAQGLMRRQFLNIMPIVALLTIVSGFWLYWRMSGGFQSEYMGSPMGMAFGTGGVLAVLAFLLGVTIVRPSMMKAARLTQEAGAASPEDKPRLMGEAQTLRARAGKAGNVVALLLILTAAVMAVARYL